MLEKLFKNLDKDIETLVQKATSGEYDKSDISKAAEKFESKYSSELSDESKYSKGMRNALNDILGLIKKYSKDNSADDSVNSFGVKNSEINDAFYKKSIENKLWAYNILKIGEKYKKEKEEIENSESAKIIRGYAQEIRNKEKINNVKKQAIIEFEPRKEEIIQEYQLKIKKEKNRMQIDIIGTTSQKRNELMANYLKKEKELKENLIKQVREEKESLEKIALEKLNN